jgi:hypothetical protein
MRRKNLRENLNKKNHLKGFIIQNTLSSMQNREEGASKLSKNIYKNYYILSVWHGSKYLCQRYKGGGGGVNKF